MTTHSQSDQLGTRTANSGLLKVYERCDCCTYCETFLDATVTCPSCGQPCSCEGCIADQPDKRDQR